MAWRIKIGKTVKKYLASVMVLAMLAGGLTVQAAENTAATMQMAKAEGSVEISGSSGKTISLIDNMKLYNGYAVSTLEKSYAWIKLDGAKLAKLDALSDAIIRKRGKKLEILMDSGNIFFNVSEPLKDDETLNIRTSTMVTGIRGTSGWVEVMDRENVKISILEGNVEVNVTDPLTGQVKNNNVSSGETAVCTVYSQGGNEGDGCDIQRESYTKEDIGGFVLQEVFSDNALSEKIVEKGGLDLRDLTQEEVDERLKKDEEVVHAKVAEVEVALAEQKEKENVSSAVSAAVWADNKAVAETIPEEIANVADLGDPVIERANPVAEPLAPTVPNVVNAEEVPANVMPTVVPVEQPKVPANVMPTVVPVEQPKVPEPPNTTYEPEDSNSSDDSSNSDNASGLNPVPAPDSNSCGDGVLYSYTDDGKTLIISNNGNGEMYNYGEGTAALERPWHNNSEQVIKIQIGEGVTHIGNHSFNSLFQVQEVILPSSVVSIGKYAFFSCLELGTMTLPNEVKTIGEFAFAGNNTLNNLFIPKGVTEIGEAAFGNCVLQNVSFGGTQEEWNKLVENKDVFRGNQPTNGGPYQEPTMHYGVTEATTQNLSHGEGEEIGVDDGSGEEIPSLESPDSGSGGSNENGGDLPES